MAAYDDFAWFYERYWNEEFHGLAFPILERVWLTRVPGEARILDLCCGTGYLAGLLTAHGYSVTGVDESEEMIRLARAHAPEAEFHVAAATEFKLPGKYEAAVSTFDSLNHLTDSKSLEAAFCRVAEVLEPGGVFAFDMLLESAYQTNWGDSYALVRDDHVLTIVGPGYDFRTHLARCTVTMFRLISGEWKRSDVTIVERFHKPAEINRALARAGFGEVCCYDAGDLGMSGQLGEGRTFFVAVRQ
jgi:SAM-dependent methyltransferase